MASPQAQPIHWSENKYKELKCQLEGFWAQDEWDMSNCPLATEDIIKSKSNYLRKIRFDCMSPLIKNEIKYACWKKFQNQEWSITTITTINCVNAVVEWLNTVAIKTSSLLQKEFKQWELSMCSYLVEHGKSVKRTYSVIDSNQTRKMAVAESNCISTLRQIYKVIQAAYDDRPEYEKDAWDVRKMGVKINLSTSSYTISFTKLDQFWLYQAAKKFIRYTLSTNSYNNALNRMTALNKFSVFLRKCHPLLEASNIDRPLVVEYLSYLAKLNLSKKSRGDYITNLKMFLKLCAREGWATVPNQELIYQEDTPQPDKHLPRYIPQEVLDQLNQHVDALPPYIMRMVIVHQECGRRINELCTLPLNCLLQDANGDYFLHYNNSKMNREKIIPMSKETAAVILSQQEVVIKEWGKDFSYLFPAPKPRGKGEPVKQFTFSKALNKLAYEKNICDSTGKLWRFESHQFRHTVGTRMANLGVPIHIIKQYLDHDTFEMTMRYVTIHDKTLKEEFIKYRDKMVDVTGKLVSYESVASDLASGVDPNSIDAQWLKKNIRAQALPTGLCGLTVNQPVCPHGANKCLTGSDGKGCPHFKTDIRYLEMHKDHLRRTNENIEWGHSNPDSRRSQEILDVNLPVKQSLERIIPTLESQCSTQQ